MLRLDNVEVRYSGIILAATGVTLELGDHGMVALLGANGAGKSSILKAISGLLEIELGKVSRGCIKFNGVRVDDKSPEDIIKMGIIQVLEGRRICEHLTTEENLIAGALGSGSDSKVGLSIVYDYFPKLKELRHQVSGYLSGGEQQMLVIGRALIGQPKVMLLDEPSLGLAPLLVEEIFGIVKRINAEENTAILMVEQNARAALSLVEYAYVMENGRMVLEGPASKLKDNEDIREFYLGLSRMGKKKSYREIKHYKRRKSWL